MAKTIGGVSTPEYFAMRKRELKAEGKCYRCKGKAAKDRTRCRRCLDKESRQSAERSKRARKRGACPSHPTALAVEGRTVCQTCLWTAGECSLRLNYSITLEDYAWMELGQKRTCAICDKTWLGKYSLCVDHDHLTGRVRGLLCGPCNGGLAYVESQEFSSRATSYLRRYNGD